MGLELMPDKPETTTAEPAKQDAPKEKPLQTRFKQKNGRFGHSSSGFAGKTDEQIPESQNEK